MSHAPDTTTLERYYEKGSSSIDVTSAALGEEGTDYEQMDLKEVDRNHSHGRFHQNSGQIPHRLRQRSL